MVHERPCSSTLLEAEALVEADRRVVAIDAQAEPPEAVAPWRDVDQAVEQLLAEPAATAARDDRDRQLGRLLVHEAVARLALA